MWTTKKTWQDAASTDIQKQSYEDNSVDDLKSVSSITQIRYEEATFEFHDLCDTRGAATAKTSSIHPSYLRVESIDKIVVF